MMAAETATTDKPAMGNPARFSKTKDTGLAANNAAYKYRRLKSSKYAARPKPKPETMIQAINGNGKAIEGTTSNANSRPTIAVMTNTMPILHSLAFLLGPNLATPILGRVINLFPAKNTSNASAVSKTWLTLKLPVGSGIMYPHDTPMAENNSSLNIAKRTIPRKISQSPSSKLDA